MAPHPLCNLIPLKTGTKALAIINVTMSSCLLVAGMLMVRTKTFPVIKKSTAVSEVTINSRCFGTAQIMFGTIALIVSVLLLQGVIKKNVWKLRVFVVMQMITASIFIIEIIKNPSSICFSLMGIVFETYPVWVVEAFIREVELEEESTRV